MENPEYLYDVPEQEPMQIQPGDVIRCRQWSKEDLALLPTFASNERLFGGDLRVRMILERAPDGLYLTQGIPFDDSFSRNLRTLSQRYIDRHAQKLLKPPEASSGQFSGQTGENDAPGQQLS